MKHFTCMYISVTPFCVCDNLFNDLSVSYEMWLFKSSLNRDIFKVSGQPIYLRANKSCPSTFTACDCVMWFMTWSQGHVKLFDSAWICGAPSPWCHIHFSYLFVRVCFSPSPVSIISDLAGVTDASHLNEERDRAQNIAQQKANILDLNHVPVICVWKKMIDLIIICAIWGCQMDKYKVSACLPWKCWLLKKSFAPVFNILSLSVSTHWNLNQLFLRYTNSKMCFMMNNVSFLIFTAAPYITIWMHTLGGTVWSGLQHKLYSSSGRHWGFRNKSTRHLCSETSSFHCD